jgi:hypothetical protein
LKEINDKNLQKKQYLSTKVVSFLPLFLLIPTQYARATWWPFANSGPTIFMFIAAFILLFLFIYESIQESKVVKLSLVQKLFFLWLLHTFISIALILIGARPSLESIGARIYVGVPPYFIAFMVFIIIEKNKWKIRDFENVVKVLLFVSAVWSIECILAWYLGFTLPGLSSANIEGEEWFSSGFTNSLHTVSKASLIMFWLSIYMFYRHEKSRYLLFTLGSFLTIIANLNRATNALLIAGLILFLYFMFVRYSRKKSNQSKIKQTFKALFGISAALVIISGSVLVNANVKGSLLADSHGFIERAYQYSRAVELIIQNPQGVGAGIGYNYAYSEEVPQLFTEDLINIEPFSTFSKFYQSGILGANLQQKKVGEADSVYSIHNFSLNIIMDYGVFGLIIIIFYIYWLLRFLKFAGLLFKLGYKSIGVLFLSLTIAQGAAFVAMQATYKFFPWMWLLVFLFLFSKAIINGSIREQRKQMQLNNGIISPLSEVYLLSKI